MIFCFYPAAAYELREAVDYQETLSVASDMTFLLRCIPRFAEPLRTHGLASSGG